jgi:hypothetical protein
MKLQVFEVDDGCTYWIAATSVRSALEQYWCTLAASGSSDPEESLTVDLVTEARAKSVKIRDEIGDREISAWALAAEAEAPTLLGCSEW